MSKGELNGEQKSVVWRYVEIWRRWRRLPSGYRSFAGLDDDMAQGFGMLLCGILVESQSSSVITADTKDPEFFAAIFGSDNPSCRTDARRITKSCTAPARHAPMTIQMNPGAYPHCAANTGKVSRS